MSWLDNMISFISPSWGARREAWRRYGDELRNYDAAGYGNGSVNWRVLNQSAELTDRYSRDTIRARGRDLERNSDMLNSVVNAYKRNVFGSGYVLRSRTGEENIDNALEKAWKRWCKKQNCDVTCTQSFNQMMRMCVQRKKVDGGILILKRYTNQGFIPFQLQTMEVDELDTAQVQSKAKGNKVVGGIEYNRWNRPVGYWFRQYDLDGSLSMAPIYVEAKDVIFYFTKRRPSQVREMSDLSPTMTRIRDANEYMTAVAVKERIAACLSVFVTKMNPSNIVLRSSVQNVNRNTGGTISTQGMRIVFRGRPTAFNPGTLKQGDVMNASVTLELTYVLFEIGGESKLELDKLNSIYKVNGVDLLADIRKQC